MRTITIYSSTPETTQLAVAFQWLKRQGPAVQVQPLSARPASAPPPDLRQALLDDLEAVCVELVQLGERLEWHERGQWPLSAGDEQGLLARQDDLRSRKRGLEGHLRGVRGG